MVALFLTPRWKAIKWFLLTNINLCQLLSEYFADVSTFLKFFIIFFESNLFESFLLSLQIFRNAKATARMHKNIYRFNKNCRRRTFLKNYDICR